MALGLTGRATHVVARPFEAGGRVLAHGVTVDASAWRNTEKLVEQRYLVPIASGGGRRGVAPTTVGEGDE